MPNKKISELPIANNLIGSEPLPTVQLGTTVKTTVQDVANLAGNTVTFPNTLGLTQSDVGKLLMNTAEGLTPTMNEAGGNGGWLKVWGNFPGVPESRLLRVTFSGSIPTDGNSFSINGSYGSSSGIVGKTFYWRNTPMSTYDIQIGVDIEACIDNMISKMATVAYSSDVSVTKIDASTIEIDCAPDSVDVYFPIYEYYQSSINVNSASMSMYTYPSVYRNAQNIYWITDNQWYEVYDNINNISGYSDDLFKPFIGAGKLGVNKWGRIIPTSTSEIITNLKITLESLLTGFSITEEEDNSLLIVQNYIPTVGADYSLSNPSFIGGYDFEYPTPSFLYVKNPVVGKLIAVTPTVLSVTCAFVFKIKTLGDIHFSTSRRSTLSFRILVPTDDGALIPIGQHPAFVGISGHFSPGDIGDDDDENTILDVIASIPMYEALEEADAGEEVLVRQNTLLATIYINESSSNYYD